jgi:hypothetical protein
VAVGATTRYYNKIAAHKNGNVYAASSQTGYVFMQTAGSGDFISLAVTEFGGVTCLAGSPAGDMYALEYFTDKIFKQTNGTGAFSLASTMAGAESIGYVPVVNWGYWSTLTDAAIAGDTEPTMSGTVIHITSNYTDLGISNEKRTSRVYLPTESEYAVNGAFYIEPDYQINLTTHAAGETSEPAGSVSMRPIAHPGKKSFYYTNGSFDETVENWENLRIDVGAKGSAFRYTIRMGDVTGGNHGVVRIRPPMIDVQILPKQ